MTIPSTIGCVFNHLKWCKNDSYDEYHECTNYTKTCSFDINNNVDEDGPIKCTDNTCYNYSCGLDACGSFLCPTFKCAKHGCLTVDAVKCTSDCTDKHIYCAKYSGACHSDATCEGYNCSGHCKTYKYTGCDTDKIKTEPSNPNPESAPTPPEPAPELPTPDPEPEDDDTTVEEDECTFFITVAPDDLSEDDRASDEYKK